MATKYPIQEIPFEKMTEESFDCAEPTIYAVLKEGVRFEFLVKREREREREARGSLRDGKSYDPQGGLALLFPSQLDEQHSLQLHLLF